MNKIFGLVLLSMTFSSHAEGLKNIKEAEALLAKAMKHMDKLEYGKGFSILKPYWPLPEHEIDNVVYKIKQQQPLIIKRFGAPIGSEKACVQSIGDSWKRIMYLQKFEKHTLLWRADFYKPKEEWVVNSFAFQDTWQTLFGQDCSNN